MGAISTRSSPCSCAMRRASCTPNRPSCEPSTPMRRHVREVISPLTRGPSFLAISLHLPLSATLVCVAHTKRLPATTASGRQDPPTLAVRFLCLTRQLPLGGAVQVGARDQPRFQKITDSILVPARRNCKGLPPSTKTPKPRWARAHDPEAPAEGAFGREPLECETKARARRAIAEKNWCPRWGSNPHEVSLRGF